MDEVYGEGGCSLNNKKKVEIKEGIENQVKSSKRYSQ